ncbi:MAG: PIN domain-containing protein [Bradymonadaceae bacterium]
MRVLVDTNVWLDILQDRRPFYEASARALTILEHPEYKAYMGATTVTTLFYLLSKHAGSTRAVEVIGELLKRYKIALVDAAVLRAALATGFDDFEDAVLHEAACHAGLDAIVTRDVRGFIGATLPIYTPIELIAAYEK